MQFIQTEISDLSTVAQCHMTAFPKSLSTRLGRSYCARMLSWYIESDRGLLFHLAEGNEVLGYCGGIINRFPGEPGSATSMTQHTFSSLVLKLMFRPWLVFHKEILANGPLIIRNIRLRFISRSSKRRSLNYTATRDFIPSIGLVVIGVSPLYQRKGYGSALLEEFEARARREGFKRITLSVHKGNHTAIKSYRRNGWLVGREDAKGLYMFKEL